MRRFPAIFLVVVALLTLSNRFDESPARAALIHSGASDPTTEGWSLFESPSNTATLSGGIDTKAFWEVDATTNSNSFVGYRITDANPEFITVLNNALGWTFKVTARVEQEIDYPLFGFIAHANAPSFSVGDFNTWGFHLVGENVGANKNNVAGAYYLDQGLNLVLLQAIDISEYHDYELRMNRNGLGSADDTVSYYIDGGFVTTLGRTDVLGETRRLLFGDSNSLSGGSVTRFNLVEFAAIPEPASLALAALGGAMALWCCMMRRLPND